MTASGEGKLKTPSLCHKGPLHIRGPLGLADRRTVDRLLRNALDMRLASGRPSRSKSRQRLSLLAIVTPQRLSNSSASSFKSSVRPSRRTRRAALLARTQNGTPIHANSVDDQSPAFQWRLDHGVSVHIEDQTLLLKAPVQLSNWGASPSFKNTEALPGIDDDRVLVNDVLCYGCSAGEARQMAPHARDNAPFVDLRGVGAGA